MPRRVERFTTVRSIGGLLPSDLLARISAADRGLDGMSGDDYHLAPGENLREVIARSWNRLRGVWAHFGAERARLAERDLGTSVTRERWLLLLFQELGYGRLQATPAIDVKRAAYPVSHRWGHTPIHLVSYRLDLDRRASGVAGAARWSPHGMVQELLNRSEDHLWALVSNGLMLRVLRDNVSLSRQSYLEFDLQAMMDGEVYADFVLLWLVCHQSRVEGERPELCWLERWKDTSVEEGTRALDRLRDSVESALRLLGTGLLSHPDNQELRARVSAGELSTQELYRQLLRLVYRLLFLFVAEERDLLLLPEGETKPHLRERYLYYYSTRRLRDLARRHVGSPHSDLWFGLQVVMRRLGSDEGCPELALPALGGQLWDPDLTPDLADTSLRNDHLLEAVRALAYTRDANVVRAVDYRNLGSEELGSVYESLLELHPHVSPAGWSFTLEAGAGSERKTTGSYYTPTPLINQLLDTALDPVLDRAMAADDPEHALLDLKVVDPAVGSGHFLVAAANRMAKRLATVRSGEGEPSPHAIREALRDVVSRCLYAVDVNPMALELAKVSLWLDAQDPSKPLTFLDHHLKVGNSLLGTTPALVARGIPDDAFKPIEGDDKAACTLCKKRNRQARDKGQDRLDVAAEAAPHYDALADRAERLSAQDDGTIDRVRAKEAAYRSFESSPELRRQKAVADAWCTAFTAAKRNGDDGVQPFELFYRLGAGSTGALAGLDVVAEQRVQYRFFHWHLEFPDVFAVPDGSEFSSDEPCGWTGGFDVVLGNPPWDQVQFDDREFFAPHRPDIADAPNMAARKRMLRKLADEDPRLANQYEHSKRIHDGLKHILHESGRFPLTSYGRMNTAPLFAELNRQVLDGPGRAGFIVPTGIATDYYNRFYFADLVATGTLVSLLDFENRRGIFPDVDSRMKFSLLTIAGGEAPAAEAEFAFFALDVADLRDPERRFTLTPEDIRLINPNTLTAPVFRTRRDAEITAKIYRRVPVLIREGDPNGNPWGIDFMLMFMMNTDSHLFRTREQLEAEGWTLDGNVYVRGTARYLPLYEAKMIHHFDHRWATYQTTDTIRNVTLEEKQDPNFEPLPRYWVPLVEVEERLREKNWPHNWLLGWRDIARNTDERTLIATFILGFGVNHKTPLALLLSDPSMAGVLSAVWSSFVLDYVLRQKLGGSSVTFFYVKQLPVHDSCHYKQPAPWAADETAASWINNRVVELVYRSRAMESITSQLDHDAGPPFTFKPERHSRIRHELDAALFYLYGLEREEVEYVMNTFSIVRNRESAANGDYQTKELILQIYDELVEAVKTGKTYRTHLDPPPAHPSLRHPE